MLPSASLLAFPEACEQHCYVGLKRGCLEQCISLITGGALCGKCCPCLILDVFLPTSPIPRGKCHLESARSVVGLSNTTGSFLSSRWSMSGSILLPICMCNSSFPLCSTLKAGSSTLGIWPLHLWSQEHFCDLYGQALKQNPELVVAVVDSPAFQKAFSFGCTWTKLNVLVRNSLG